MKDPNKVKVLMILGLICALGLALLIAGVVVMNQSSKSCNVKPGSTGRQSNPQLIAFIKKVQKTYYKINPNKIVYMPDVNVANIRQEFSAYDAKPESIKKRTE